jgi:hypothetical protein
MMGKEHVRPNSSPDGARVVPHKLGYGVNEPCSINPDGSDEHQPTHLVASQATPTGPHAPAPRPEGHGHDLPAADEPRLLLTGG